MAASFYHAMAHFGNKFVVFQAPTGDGKKAGWRLRHKAFKDKVGAEAFEEVDDEVDVFVGCKEMEILRILGIFLCHACTFDELKLVEFEGGERKRGEGLGFGKHGFFALMGKTQNEVCTNPDASGCCTSDGIDGLGMKVTTIDAHQSCVTHRFDAVFYEKEGAMVEVGEIVEKSRRHAVGTSTYDETDNIGNGEGFFVFGFQMVNGIVGVGICLKIGEVLHVGVFSGKEAFAFFQLLRDGLGGGTIVGVEGLVVAIGATTRAHPTVAVGAGKASIDGNFLGLSA